MDRFFYWIIGSLAAIGLVIGMIGYKRSRATFSMIEAAKREALAAEATPTPPPLPAPGTPFLFGKSDAPDVLPPPVTPTPMPAIAMATPVPWTPPNPGQPTFLTYPGFTVVYSTALGNPLAVQYAMVGGAKPKRYPEPTKVRTPDSRLIQRAGYERGPMALPESIGLYFGKTSIRNTELMTNTCAMTPTCLGGPWSQFAELEARWAGEAGWIEVVAGPIFSTPPAQAAGLVIPDAFYRAYRRSYGDTIAFIIPQTAVSQELTTYLTSISAIESATGMAIFQNTLSPEARAETASALW